jgi:hypothetical protein
MQLRALEATDQRHKLFCMLQRKYDGRFFGGECRGAACSPHWGKFAGSGGIS